jgi:PKD repeat protein
MSKTSFAQCDADFTTSIDTNTNRVSFIYIDTNSNVNHSWRLGLVTINEPITSFVFPYAGAYNITHIVVDSFAPCVDSFATRIVIMSDLECYANFVATESIDGRVTFTNNGIGQQFFWDFGDGRTSTNAQPVHQYKDNDEFTVCMVAQSANRTCSDTVCQNVLIQTADTTGCDASFSGIFLDRTRVRFEAGVPGYESYSWDFGDNSMGTGDTVIHEYQDTGEYTACLTVYNARLNCYDTVCKLVKVFPPTRCDAEFTIIQRSYDSVSLIPNQQNYDRYTWFFGTGDSSTQVFPTYRYQKDGIYEICLEVFDSTDNCNERSCRQVQIKPECKAAFNVGLDTTISNVLFLINRSSNFVSHQYSWTFGDGGTSTLRNPTHTFQEFRAYPVCLLIKDDELGCEISYCDSIGLDENGKLLKNGAFELIVIDFEELSTNQLEKLEVDIYPNPASYSFHVKLKNDRPTTVNVTGVTGSKMVNKRNNSSSFDVSVSNWPKGIYILRLMQGNKMITKKIIVQ